VDQKLGYHLSSRGHFVGHWRSSTVLSLADLALNLQYVTIRHGHWRSHHTLDVSLHYLVHSGHTRASKASSAAVQPLEPSTHRRRRRHETVLSRRVGGVYMNSRRLPTDSAMRTHNAAVGRNPVYNTAPNGSRLPTGVFTPTTRRNCRQLVANSLTHRRRDATRQFRLVGVGGVYWALIGLYCKIYQLIGDLPAVILLSWTFFLEWFSCASNLCENSSK